MVRYWEKYSHTLNNNLYQYHSYHSLAAVCVCVYVVVAVVTVKYEEQIGRIVFVTRARSHLHCWCARKFKAKLSFRMCE